MHWQTPKTTEPGFHSFIRTVPCERCRLLEVFVSTNYVVKTKCPNDVCVCQFCASFSHVWHTLTHTHTALFTTIMTAHFQNSNYQIRAAAFFSGRQNAILPKAVHFRFIAVQIDVYGRNGMASCVCVCCHCRNVQASNSKPDTHAIRRRKEKNLRKMM